MGQMPARIWTPFLVLIVLASSASTLPVMAQADLDASPKTRQKIVVGVMATPPYSMQEDDGTWSGITVDLWKEIAGITHVDYEFKKFALKDLLAGLADGSVDVAASGISITSAREEKFDFSDPYLAAIESVAVNADQQPNLFQLVRSAFFNWSLLFFLLFILAVTVGGAAILWLLEHKGESEHYQGKTRKAFGKSLFWSTVVLSGKDFPKAIGWSTVPPATFAGRMFGTVWMVVGIILISLFTATAASVLTSKQLMGVIRDSDDLRHVTVGTVASSVGHDYLNKHNIKCNHLYAGPVEMLTALSEHKCDAVVYNRHIMMYYARSMYLNKIIVLRFPLRQDFLAIPMRTGSPLKESINRAMLDVVESKRWQAIVSNYLGNDWADPSSVQ